MTAESLGRNAWYTHAVADCGWYVPKSAGNPGKIAEYEDRKTYKTDEK